MDKDRWPKCRLCEERHPLGGDHIFKDAPQGKPDKPDKPVVHPKVVEPVEDKTPSGRSQNRVARSKYNAYMKSYMKVWRALKAHRADPWPKEA